MKNEIVGFVTTYEDDNGDLVLCNPDFDIDWDWLESIREDSAIFELLEFQLCNGYEMILPEEIGALTSAPIIGKDIVRDEENKIISADCIWWLDEYATIDVIEELKSGNKVVFKLAQED